MALAILLVAIAIGGLLLRSARHSGAPCSSGTSGCAAGLPTGRVTLQQVRAHPEAALHYPGSSVVQPFGGPEIVYPNGEKNSAFSGAILRSSDSPIAIYQWYHRWLLDHGWRSYDMARLSTEVSVEGYARGTRERFDVAIEDPASLARTLGHPIPPGETVFEARYIIFPN